VVSLVRDSTPLLVRTGTGFALPVSHCLHKHHDLRGRQERAGRVGKRAGQERAGRVGNGQERAGRVGKERAGREEKERMDYLSANFGRLRCS